MLPKIFKPTVGLFAGSVVAVNPDEERMEQLTGRKPGFPLNYDGVAKKTWSEDGQSGIEYMAYPINFYIKTVLGDDIKPINFNITDTDRPQSQSGKYQFVNDYGKVYWTEDPTGEPTGNMIQYVDTEYEKKDKDGNITIEPLGKRRTRINEAELIDFLLKLTNKRDSGDNADPNFIPMFDAGLPKSPELGIKKAALFNPAKGNTSGFDVLVRLNNRFMTFLNSCYEKDGKYRTTVVNTFTSYATKEGEVPQKVKENLAKRRAKVDAAIAAGQTGFDITRNMYSIEPVEVDAETVKTLFNYVEPGGTKATVSPV